MRKKIEKMKKLEQDFYKRLVLTIVSDSFIKNFVDDKEFLGEDLLNYKEKTPSCISFMMNQILCEKR